MAEAGFWDNQEQAQEKVGELKSLMAIAKPLEESLQASEDLDALFEMAEEDESLEDEVMAELTTLEEQVEQLQLNTLLSGPHDRAGAIMTIHARDGGTDANDWAEMLLRMYIRWGEAKGYKVELVAETQGEEAGIKSATLQIKGHNAYGWLRTESGVHRLVRISPYDSQARRHTSFASVWVYPIVDDSIEIEIPESDVRIDTYRASGAGGQHVNTTDSAVRITHNPTGIVVQCQNERSQHKNRATAWTMLRARLYEAELQRREEEAQEQAASKTEIGWGHQIRSYVLQPYQLVKDLRTGVEIGNPQAVLDGGIDPFLAAALANKVETKEEAAAEVAE